MWWSARSSPKRALHHALGERHADGGGDALAERAGGRLDPRRMAVFGMAGGHGAELAEVLRARRWSIARIAGEMEQPNRAASSRGPAESTKRSRSGQSGALASNFRNLVNSTVATSAMPIGMPGWPEFAFSTASMAARGSRWPCRDAWKVGPARQARFSSRIMSLPVSPSDHERPALIFDERMDQRRQDQLHGEIELPPWDDDGIGAAT